MRKLALVIIALALGAPAVVAHHSHAMFDTSREVALTGTVTQVSYRNPHVFVHVDVKGEDGTVVNWAVEMSNITNMESRGIYRSTLKVGEELSIRVNPLKNGRPGGNYTSLTTADGKTFE
jgi:hypothetical protein